MHSTGNPLHPLLLSAVTTAAGALGIIINESTGFSLGLFLGIAGTVLAAVVMIIKLVWWLANEFSTLKHGQEAAKSGLEESLMNDKRIEQKVDEHFATNGQRIDELTKELANRPCAVCSPEEFRSVMKTRMEKP